MTKFSSTQSFKDKLISREEAALTLGVTAGTLAVWACTGRYKLPYIKIGSSVKYRLSDLEHFINERVRGGSDALDKK